MLRFSGLGKEAELTDSNSSSSLVATACLLNHYHWAIKDKGRVVLILPNFSANITFEQKLYFVEPYEFCVGRCELCHLCNEIFYDNVIIRQIVKTNNQSVVWIWFFILETQLERLLDNDKETRWREPERLGLDGEQMAEGQGLSQGNSSVFSAVQRTVREGGRFGLWDLTPFCTYNIFGFFSF